MSTSIKPAHYVTLVNDITALYDVARHALVEAYWQIGKRIVEEEQKGQENAVYGEHLLDQLSEDLSASVGSGFSRRNIYNMRQFYLTHKIVPPVAQLTWTQHLELLPINDRHTKLTSMPDIYQTFSTCRAVKMQTGSVARAISSIRYCSIRGWPHIGSRDENSEDLHSWYPSQKINNGRLPRRASSQ